jgi:mycothiol synthase
VHHVEVKRRMGEADIGALTRLLDVASAADGHRALGEHKWLDLVQGGREGFAGFIAREPDHHRLIGYAQISRGESSSWAVEYVVHPGWRQPDFGLREDLVRAALDEIALQGGGHVHVWVPMPTEADDAVAAALGLRRGRDLHQMRRPLPLDDQHSSLPTRPFRPGVDEERWLAVNNQAFRGHPEQGVWTLETIVDRERQDWFDPAGFLLYDLDGDLAGFCWTKVHEEEQLGEIYVIAVNPYYQGRGFGKQLLLAGLDHLSDRGVPTAMLYVDHDNAEAVGLYKSLGFSVDHVDRAYTGDIAANAFGEPGTSRQSGAADQPGH